MTDLTMNMGGRVGFGGSRLREIAVAWVACRRWAYAMQGRYDRLGARGFQPDVVSFEALVAGLEPDHPGGRRGLR